MGVLIAAVSLVAAWLIDARAHRDEVLLNATLAGRKVRGADVEQLERHVREIASAFSTATVEVKSPGGGFQATIPELGVTIDESRTVAAALDTGRGGSPPGRLWNWASSFISAKKVPVTIEVDRAKLDAVVAERDPLRAAPVEPSFVLQEGKLEAVAGKSGKGVDPAKLAEALRRATPGGGTIVVSLEPTSIKPRFGKPDAEKLADEAERLAAAGLKVGIGDATAAVPAEMLVSWLSTSVHDGSLVLGVRPDAEVDRGLAELFPDAGVKPTDAGFALNGGRVQITPAKTGRVCCAPEARDVLASTLADPAKWASAVQLPLKDVAPARDEEAARKLGIVEQISTFTTPHNAGEPRVKNIQLMADTVRGAVIEPGQTFSINGFVGRRTREKGYVEAPIITNEYKFEADVGGGVSQFATTMFNAAFFAGLDIPDYAMHGLYISRYPYGREATLSFPSPDLKVRNQTPYGVLVWTSYTSSSITVSFYSTTYARSEQSGQAVADRPAVPPPPETTTTTTTTVGPDITVPSTTVPPEPPPERTCQAVTTTRIRRYPDGQVATDRFSALYAPAEGWSCR